MEIALAAVAARLRRADTAQPARAGAASTSASRRSTVQLQDQPDRARLSGRGARRSLLRAADGEARVAARHASIGAISYLPLSGEGQSVAAAPATQPARARRRDRRRLGHRARPLLRDDGRRAAAADGSSRPTIGRARRRSRSWTTCWRGGCGRTKRRRSASACGSAPAPRRDAHHRRRRAPRQPRRARQGLAADGLRAAVAGLSARHVHGDPDDAARRRR